jgi:hypothetical protein
MMKTEEIKYYIQSVRWKFASSMPQIPHEYTLKEWNPAQIDTFNAFVVHIRENGYKELFYGKAMTYFDVDDHKYWTMGAPLEETILINRAKI